MESKSPFAGSHSVSSIDDCIFYHVMDIEGHGVTEGQWDLRGQVDEYLGYFPFAGKRVLEIGPASGFLTFEMEKRGGEVVAVEVPDDPGWDFVPYPETVTADYFGPRREVMRKVKNSFWFNHRINRSNARLCYADACNLPEQIGQFDASVMAAVLLHCQNPVRIVEQCARRSRSIVITEVYDPKLEGEPVCRLVPTAENRALDTWWQFSSAFFTNYLAVLGFRYFHTSRHSHLYCGQGKWEFFTVVASKDELALTDGTALAPIG